MTTSTKAPVLFISHGAPTFAIEPGVLGPQLRALGAQLGQVKAVLVVSPHWQTRDVKVMTTAKPETIHDFGGFPAILYELAYPASGAPEVARQAPNCLSRRAFASVSMPVAVSTMVPGCRCCTCCPMPTCQCFRCPCRTA